MKKIIITLDGPAGSGKSTTAREVARKINYTYLDTGAMYRAITLAVLEKKINPSHVADIIALLPDVQLLLTYENGTQKTFLNGRDVSEDIRSIAVTQNVSAISSIREVRQFLVKQQREIGKQGGFVIDGRDAGTVIFPNAELKFFLTANVEERAKRRQTEMAAKGTHISLEDMIADIRSRDELDSNREESPLVKAAGAIELDNSAMTIDEQVDFVVNTFKTRFGN
ncbi:(d)CMP kinase [bacterium]|nr:(d)CMP kinase [bacterium]